MAVFFWSCSRGNLAHACFYDGRECEQLFQTLFDVGLAFRLRPSDFEVMLISYLDHLLHRSSVVFRCVDFLSTSSQPFGCPPLAGDVSLACCGVRSTSLATVGLESLFPYCASVAPAGFPTPEITNSLTELIKLSEVFPIRYARPTTLRNRPLHLRGNCAFPYPLFPLQPVLGQAFHGSFYPGTRRAFSDRVMRRPKATAPDFRFVFARADRFRSLCQDSAFRSHFAGFASSRAGISSSFFELEAASGPTRSSISARIEGSWHGRPARRSPSYRDFFLHPDGSGTDSVP